MHGITTSQDIAGTGGTLSERGRLAGEYRTSLKVLSGREKTLAAALEDAPEVERYSRVYELKMVREMIREHRETIRQLEPPRCRRTGERKSLDAGGLTGRRLEYLAWARAESFDRNNDRQREAILSLLDEAVSTLTERQREVFDLHRSGLRQREIADRLGLDKSTVSRALAGAMERVRRFVSVRRLAEQAAEPDGGADLTRLLEELDGLTPLQRRVLLMAEAGKDKWNIAVSIGRTPSKTDEILNRAKKRLRRISEEVSVVKVHNTIKCKRGGALE